MSDSLEVQQAAPKRHTVVGSHARTFIELEKTFKSH